MTSFLFLKVWRWFRDVWCRHCSWFASSCHVTARRIFSLVDCSHWRCTRTTCKGGRGVAESYLPFRWLLRRLTMVTLWEITIWHCSPTTPRYPLLCCRLACIRLADPWFSRYQGYAGYASQLVSDYLYNGPRVLMLIGGGYSTCTAQVASVAGLDKWRIPQVSCDCMRINYQPCHCC